MVLKAQLVAEQNGSYLNLDAAEAVVRAVLGYSEGARTVQVGVTSPYWDEIPDAREAVRRNLRRQLTEILAAESLVPTGLPEETVTDTFATKTVTWTVPVRRPL